MIVDIHFMQVTDGQSQVQRAELLVSHLASNDVHRLVTSEHAVYHTLTTLF